MAGSIAKAVKCMRAGPLALAGVQRLRRAALGRSDNLWMMVSGTARERVRYQQYYVIVAPEASP